MTGTGIAGIVAVSLRTHALSLPAAPFCFWARQCRFTTAAHLIGMHDMQTCPKLKLHVLSRTRWLPTCVECWCGCVHYVFGACGYRLRHNILRHSLRHVCCVCAVPGDQACTVLVLSCLGLMTLGLWHGCMHGTAQ
jgi:hypothetical protein